MGYLEAFDQKSKKNKKKSKQKTEEQETEEQKTEEQKKKRESLTGKATLAWIHSGLRLVLAVFINDYRNQRYYETYNTLKNPSADYKKRFRRQFQWNKKHTASADQPLQPHGMDQKIYKDLMAVQRLWTRPVLAPAESWFETVLHSAQEEVLKRLIHYAVLWRLLEPQLISQEHTSGFHCICCHTTLKDVYKHRRTNPHLKAFHQYVFAPAQGSKERALLTYFLHLISMDREPSQKNRADRVFKQRNGGLWMELEHYLKQGMVSVDRLLCVQTQKQKPEALHCSLCEGEKTYTYNTLYDNMGSQKHLDRIQNCSAEQVKTFFKTLLQQDSWVLQASRNPFHTHEDENPRREASHDSSEKNFHHIRGRLRNFVEFAVTSLKDRKLFWEYITRSARDELTKEKQRLEGYLTQLNQTNITFPQQLRLLKCAFPKTHTFTRVEDASNEETQRKITTEVQRLQDQLKQTQEKLE